MDRDMPHCWRARFEVSRGTTETLPSASVIVTSSVAVKARVPLGPFTSTVWPEMLALTPAGTGTGFLPIRDIDPSSEHGAEHFAADIGGPSSCIRHHALRRRDDGDPEALADRRDVLDAGIDAAPRLRDALDLADHRRAFEVLQADFQLSMA